MNSPRRIDVSFTVRVLTQVEQERLGHDDTGTLDINPDAKEEE